VTDERAASGLPVPVQRAVPRPPRTKVRSPRERYLPAIISVLSTIVVFILVARVVTRAEYWPMIRRQFFSLSAALDALPQVWAGFLVNMRIWAISLVFIAVGGLVIAIMRSLTGPWAAPLRVFAII